MNKIWQIAKRKYDDLFTQLLFNRGVLKESFSEADFSRYLEPDFLNNMNDPFALKDMKGAIDLIKKAIENKEKIGIFSDYDADGIPGAALLFRTFNKIKVPTSIYIPNREGGYGLSREGIDRLRNEGCKLIITVDLGIRSIEEANYCEEVGIDLIVTDHHLPGESLPKAAFVINPKQKGDSYPFKDLSGCGVAYKLAQALAKYFPKELNEGFLKWNLDLVAISTVCDVVSLSGENRIIAKFGMKVMRKTKNIGLRALIKIAKIDQENISSYHIGFLIGPRINAPGRIDNATKSFELLTTEDPRMAEELAIELDLKNQERQLEMDQIEKLAVSEIAKRNLTEKKIIILKGEWSKGVIGPTASRLVEKYFRPVILFSTKEDVYTGSARSVSGVNIVELIETVKKYVLKYGGHTGAAGLTVIHKNYDDFVNSIEKSAVEAISPDFLTKRVKIDAEIQLSDITFKLYNQILKMEPFGLGNSKPVFMVSDASFENIRFVGKNQDHFSAFAKDEQNKIKSIYFNFAHKDWISTEARFDLAFTIGEDNWNDEKKLSINILDIKKRENNGK